MALKPVVLSSVSVVALVLCGPAYSQETSAAAAQSPTEQGAPATVAPPAEATTDATIPSTGEDIIVTGVRASLSSAQHEGHDRHRRQDNWLQRHNPLLNANTAL
ncbi:MAG: hypothetical protein EOP67_33855, partial [Sphingomonas sp.]